MSKFQIKQGLDVDSNIDAIIPTGSIIAYAGTTFSTTSIDTLGMCPCDGRALSRITYANLFSVIGTTYGTGDGSTTFNVPNLSSAVKFIGGANSNSNLGTTAGSNTHTHTASTEATSTTGNASMDHTHSFNMGVGYHDVYHTHYLGAFYMYYSSGPSPTVYKSDGSASAAAINHSHSGYVPGLGWGGGTGGHSHNASGNLNTSSSTTHSHDVSSTTSSISTSSTEHPVYISGPHYIKL